MRTPCPDTSIPTSEHNDIMKLVFAGTPDFAVPSLRALHDAGHDVSLVVTQPDRPRGRGQKLAPPPVKKTARELGCAVAQPERAREEEFKQRLRALAPEIGVLVAYGELLDEDLLNIPEHGFINLHASLLPRYRGAAPIHHPILNGDETTGVSVVRMVQELDAGPILAQQEVEIGPDDTVGDLHDRLAEEGAKALADVLDRLDRGEPVAEHPQDNSQATYAPKLSRDDGRIDWSQPAQDIKNRVRGLTPWPGAYCQFVGRSADLRVILLQVQAEDSAEIHAEPGSVLSVTGDGEIIVQAGQGAVRLVKVKPAGSRAMRAADFVHGRNIEPGDRFA